LSLRRDLELELRDTNSSEFRLNDRPVEVTGVSDFEKVLHSLRSELASKLDFSVLIVAVVTGERR
jgi:hypothetical protein